jgi:hypothetical protein
MQAKVRQLVKNKNDSAQVRALVNRQVQAWEKRDFAIAAGDWLPNGELFSPGGHVVKKDMQSAILDYFRNFTDLKVTVKVHGCPLSPGTGRRSAISLLASQISRLSGSDNGREAGGVFSDARGSDVVPGIGLGHATRPVTNLARLLLRVSPAMAALER